jgi:hypothetical protein
MISASFCTFRRPDLLRALSASYTLLVHVYRLPGAPSTSFPIANASFSLVYILYFGFFSPWMGRLGGYFKAGGLASPKVSK